MLCKLSLSNVKKSFKDYAIFFVTIILGVCIFYLFNSVDSQTAMLSVTSRQGEMIDLLIEILSYVSIFVSLILGLLIIYASRFLIKKRNKEFGIYMTLGMSKRKISILLLFETLVIGFISLILGLVLGVLLSQLTSVFIADMFEANMSKYAFNFSSSAMIKTIIYFGIIYTIVMIFNAVIVNKNKLIDLLQSSKKQEKIRLKNSILSVILFIISILMLGVAYYLVTDGIDILLKYDVSILGIPILLGIFGSILFYYSVSGMFLKILSKCKKLYFKGLNTFSIKQISSKINTMVISISVICIMLFVTLCLLSSAFTIKEFYNNSINKYSPVDFELLEENGKDNIMDFVNNKYIKDVLIINEYYDETFNYGVSLGNVYESLKEQYEFILYDELVSVVKLSDYNKMARLLNYESITLNNDEYAIVSNYDSNYYEETIKSNSIINIFNHNLKPGYDRIIDGFDIIGGNPTNLGFFVIGDELVETNKYDTLIFGNYDTNDENVINDLESQLVKLDNIENVDVESKLSIKESAAGLTSIVTFIGLYLGIIFLISSAAIMSLKVLSDSIDDERKYSVLRQIGVDEKEINRSLFIQILIFFIAPLSLAIIHTIFGLKFCTFILSSLGVSNILDGSLKTFIFLILIYGLYFIITYLCSKNIIKEKISRN